jgi:cysteine-rich repeat protein
MAPDMPTSSGDMEVADGTSDTPATPDGGADGPAGDGAPDGPVVTTDGTPDGPVVTPDGPVVTPDGPVVTPDGPVVTPDGPVVTPDGPVVTPDGPVTAVCGNSVRETGEDCDDGNTTNLDGCDKDCKFEQDHRANYMLLEYGTDTFCPNNRFGEAFPNSTVQGIVQSSIDTSVQDGDVNVMFKFLGLDDLTGQNDSSLELGILSGTPVMTAAYDGTSDLDWWYTVAANTIDAQRDPLTKVQGSIASGVLTTQPAKVSITLSFAGTPGIMHMSAATLTAQTGASSTPLSSTGATPGHLASEHLNPSLQSFASMGAKTSAGAGKLCGRTSAESLAAIPMPTALIGGLLGCSGYQTANNNSMLDLIVAGCNILLLPGQWEISPTQPDTDDPTVAPVGAGPPYTLVANSTTRKVTSCRDKNNAQVNLQACLKDAAYSTFVKFATGRVIIK